MVDLYVGFILMIYGIYTQELGFFPYLTTHPAQLSVFPPSGGRYRRHFLRRRARLHVLHALREELPSEKAAVRPGPRPGASHVRRRLYGSPARTSGSTAGPVPAGPGAL